MAMESSTRAAALLVVVIGCLSLSAHSLNMRTAASPVSGVVNVNTEFALLVTDPVSRMVDVSNVDPDLMSNVHVAEYSPNKKPETVPDFPDPSPVEPEHDVEESSSSHTRRVAADPQMPMQGNSLAPVTWDMAAKDEKYMSNPWKKHFQDLPRCLSQDLRDGHVVDFNEGGENVETMKHIIHKINDAELGANFDADKATPLHGTVFQVTGDKQFFCGCIEAPEFGKSDHIPFCFDSEGRYCRADRTMDCRFK